VGTQYRSVIFYYDDEQKTLSESSKRTMDASKKFSRPIATMIVPATKFWRAEEYHQRYFEKNPHAACHI